MNYPDMHNSPPPVTGDSPRTTPGPWQDGPSTSDHVFSLNPHRIQEESDEEEESSEGDQRSSGTQTVPMNLSELIEVGVLGYEVMEPRAKFTVFRLCVNKAPGESWYLFRRYTDFVHLNEQLQQLFPSFRLALPPKKWFGDNFDRNFLNDRLSGLQAFIDAVVGHRDACNSLPVQEFLCVDDPPGPHDSLEESRALCDALEEQLYFMKQEIQAKDAKVELLQDEVHIYRQEVAQLRKALRVECAAYREQGREPNVPHAVNLVMLDLLERSMTRQSSVPASESSLTEHERENDESSDPEGICSSKTKDIIQNGPITDEKANQNGPITDKDAIQNEPITDENAIQNGPITDKDVIQNGPVSDEKPEVSPVFHSHESHDLTVTLPS